MLRLRTFGSVLVESSGQPVGGAAGQRRLLAILAILAAHGPVGVTRDKILGLLWPERDPERARHALTQSLYHIRRAFGRDDLLSAGADIRLNFDVLASDVQEFESALDAGELERAAGLHTGFFLDGFFVNDAPEFERWADTQRQRLARRYADALLTLATAATDGGEYSRAVLWLRRLVAVDPLDTRATILLMEALARAGDRASALQQARVHEVIVREQLDVAPDPAVVALVERLRDDDLWRPAAFQRAASIDAGRSGREMPDREGSAVALADYSSVATFDADSDGSTEPVDSAQEPVTTEVERLTPSHPAPRSRLRRFWLPTLAALALSTAVIVWLRTRDEPPLPVSEPRNALLIAPFRVAGADRSLAYLHEGMVDLLSIRLLDGDVARAVDPGAVLGAWRAAGLGRAEDVRRGDVLRIGDDLGASRVVVGSVVGNSDRLIIQASILAVPSGESQARALVEGPADSLVTLVDRLASHLLLAEAGEEERLARSATPSLPALRAYLNGQEAYRRGDYPEASFHLAQAIGFDSTFAIAAVQLAVAADRLNAAEQHDRALALAWAARDELSERDRAYLVAFAGPRYPAPSPEVEQIAAWQQAVALAPDRADAWHELGERFFYDGATLSLADPESRAASALKRALAIDPAFDPSRRLLAQLAARTGDTLTLRGVVPRGPLSDGLKDLSPFLAWRLAVAREDASRRQQLAAEMPLFDVASLRAIGMAAQFDAVGLEDGERALRLRRARARLAGDVLDAILAQHSLALNQGRPVLALDLTEQLQDADPASRAHLRLRVLDAMYADGDRKAAGAAADEIARRNETSTPRSSTEAAIRLADLCVLAQWRLHQGTTRGVPEAVAHLRQAPELRHAIPIGAAPRGCAEFLDATLAVMLGRPHSAAYVQRVDSLMLSGPAIGDAGNYAHLIVARLYERLGEPAKALAAIRRRPFMRGWPRYLTTALREEGRLAAATGDVTGARVAYAAYLALRAEPEARVTPEVDGVRRQLDTLP